MGKPRHRIGRALALSIGAAGFLFPQAPEEPQRAFLNQYCLGCHSDKGHTGGLSLVKSDPQKWEKVVRRLRARSMPPAGLPRPDEKGYETVIASFEKNLDRLAAEKPNPGRTDTFRRLNRTEYQNSIRDLLSLDVDVSALLPGDDSSHGFDNITVGEMPPTLLERYLSAAQKISRLAIGSPIRSPGGDTILIPPDLTQEERFDELPFGTRGGAATRHTFPLDAQYEIQLRLARDRNEHVEGLTGTHELELAIDGRRLAVFTINPPAKGEDHSKVDTGLQVRLPVTAGSHEVTAAFLKKPSALLETERQPYQAHFNMDRHPRVQPALYSISVVGPFDSKGPGATASRERIFVCHTDDEGCAKKIVSTLARRAWRKSVNDAEIQGPMRFYREARKNSGFENGIEMALRAVLMSPQFIFHIEQDPAGAAPGKAYRLSDLELANRLSFFLWSSIPDDELLDIAIRGGLRQPAVLRKEVRRMLTDQRSEALVNNFADQWLYLRNLASANPDIRTLPDFDDNLRHGA
jgi:hypothetical protein